MVHQAARSATDAGHDELPYQHDVGRLEATLTLRGAFWCCWIRDLSEIGAGLEPEIPAALGEQVELSSPHFNFDGVLSGRVDGVGDRRTWLTFTLDQGMGEKLRLFLLAKLALR